MKSRAALVVTAVVLTSAGRSVRAAGTLNVKLGTWETTTVSTTSGMHLPEAQLQQLTPEQRQRIESAMKQREEGGPKTHTTRSCITQKELERFFEDREQDEKGCKRTSVVATATKQEFVMECTGKLPRKMEVRAEALSREHVKGSMKMVSGMGNATAQFDAKWISSACEKKP
ncbi:MAG TPA: DUF3617 family protein [Anaeromyxobacteraceae bacterium]